MITSAQNPKIQRVRALLEKRKQRDAEQAFVVEGVRLVEEAQLSGWQPQIVLFDERLSDRGQVVVRGFAQAGVETVEIPARLMETISGTDAPQGLLAVFPQRQPVLPRVLDFVLIADNIRDPGNLGTLLRTAAAAGAQAALLSPGTTDAFAPKVLRSGMGAHFRLPVLHLDWDAIRLTCARHSLRIYIAEAAEGSVCWDLDLKQPVALIIGSEAEGASPEASALAQQAITIPMPGRFESLNAAVAASILLFEVVRQRR